MAGRMGVTHRGEADRKNARLKSGPFGHPLILNPKEGERGCLNLQDGYAPSLSWAMLSSRRMALAGVESRCTVSSIALYSSSVSTTKFLFFGPDSISLSRLSWISSGYAFIRPRNAVTGIVFIRLSCERMRH